MQDAQTGCHQDEQDLPQGSRLQWMHQESVAAQFAARFLYTTSLFSPQLFYPKYTLIFFSANTSYLSGRLIFSCLCTPVPGATVPLTDKKTPRFSPRGVKFRQRTRIDVFRWDKSSGCSRLAVLTQAQPQAPATCHLHAAGCLLYRGDKFRIGFDTTL